MQEAKGPKHCVLLSGQTSKGKEQSSPAKPLHPFRLPVAMETTHLLSQWLLLVTNVVMFARSSPLRSRLTASVDAQTLFWEAKLEQTKLATHKRKPNIFLVFISLHLIFTIDCFLYLFAVLIDTLCFFPISKYVPCLVYLVGAVLGNISMLLPLN